MKQPFHRTSLIKTMIPVEEKLRRLQPFATERQLRSLWNAYRLEDNHRARQEIETVIDSLFTQKTGIAYEPRIILPPPPPHETEGEISVGSVRYCGKKMQDFALKKQELLRHLGIFGQTGSGKTVCCMNLLKQFVKRKIPFLIFDWKRNYRDILNHPDFKDEEILIYTVGRDKSPFTFNPKIAPPDTDEKVWQKKLIEIMEKAYLLGPGASDVLMDVMDYPTFQEMKTAIDKQRRRGREMLWHMSSKRTLNSICFPGLNEVVNSEKSVPIEELLKRNVILELDSLSDTDKTFIIGSLLLWIYHYRMSMRERETLQHVIIIEEAHHLLLNTKKEEDITDVIMREIRELGESVVLLDQHPHKISVSALGNCFTKIGFSTSLAQDIAALSKSMLITRDQQQYFGMLKVGQAIVKTGNNPFPFLIDVPDINIRKGKVTDEAIRERMSKISSFSAPIQGFPAPRKTFQQDWKHETLSPLTPSEAILLEDIAQDPFIGVEKRYKKLGLNPREGNDIHQSLVQKKLVKPIRLEHVKLFEFTASGIATAEQNGISKARDLARGGIEHNYWLNKINKEFNKNNFEVFIEKDGIDLIAQSKQKTVAVQLETGKSDIPKNINTIHSHCSDKKIMAATNMKAKSLTDAALKKSGLGTYVQSLTAKELITIIPSLIN